MDSRFCDCVLGLEASSQEGDGEDLKQSWHGTGLMTKDLSRSSVSPHPLPLSPLPTAYNSESQQWTQFYQQRGNWEVFIALPKTPRSSWDRFCRRRHSAARALGRRHQLDLRS